MLIELFLFYMLDILAHRYYVLEYALIINFWVETVSQLNSLKFR